MQIAGRVLTAPARILISGLAVLLAMSLWMFNGGADALFGVAGFFPSLFRSPTKSVVGVVRAGGQRQYIDCRGAGGPTTVLISGLWGWSRDWADQVTPWRTGGRVCTYDRPGLGASKARAGTKYIDSGVHAKELHALLHRAGEKGPFILVGHSYGGMIGRSFNNLYPKEVRGMLLLDAVPPGIQDLYSAYDKSFVEPSASISLSASASATGWDRPLQGLPLIVLSAENPAWDPLKVKYWNQGQDRAAWASGNSIRLVAEGASHQLQLTAPEAVDKAFRLLRSGVKKGTFQPGCHADWAAVDATCTDLN